MRMSDDDEEYEWRDSLYSEMVSEAANEEASSVLDIYLMERPVSSVALESDFSTSGRILDPFRS
ncbi:unnamed protein product [Brassica oleracea var. botrytis]